MSSQPTPDDAAEFFEEIDRVFETLNLNLDWVTGFLAAVHSGPDQVTPEAWTSYVLEDLPASDEEIERRGITLMLGLSDATRDMLAARDPEALLPTDEDPEAISDFCAGYVAGAELHDTWMSDDEAQDELLPLEVLAGVAEGELAGENGQPVADPEATLGKLRAALPERLLRIYDHFAAARTAGSAKKPKVGRNDACTCGSGKKYKKCCGAAA